eukprot:11312801-Karenia_brevis.AAC.1
MFNRRNNIQKNGFAQDTTPSNSSPCEPSVGRRSGIPVACPSTLTPTTLHDRNFIHQMLEVEQNQ